MTKDEIEKLVAAIVGLKDGRLGALHILDAVHDIIDAEIEACAKLADVYHVGQVIAKEIRERKNGV